MASSIASPDRAPFAAAATYSHETEQESIFTGPSSLSMQMEIKPTLAQRLKAVDWLDWASAFGALFLMYAIIGSSFFAMLEIAEAIRGDNFRVLPAKFFGPFFKPSTPPPPPPVPYDFAAYPVGYNVPWNATLFT